MVVFVAEIFAGTGFNFCWNQLNFCCYGDNDGKHLCVLLEPEILFCFHRKNFLLAPMTAFYEFVFVLETVVHAYGGERGTAAATRVVIELQIVNEREIETQRRS
ncbi:hypothetical protein VPH35_029123 [Triticum aestivum]